MSDEGINYAGGRAQLYKSWAENTSLSSKWSLPDEARVWLSRLVSAWLPHTMQ